MQFNSFYFLFFLVAVLILYYLTMRWWKLQNLLLLAASYVFYSFGGWRWLSLLLFSTLLDYSIGRLLGSKMDHPPGNTRWRKFLLLLSLSGNLAILGIFKYFNFFSGSIETLFNLLQLRVDIPTLSLFLPLGISFWTLKSMSYTIDVYQKRLEPVHSLVDYALFLAFFPTLLAGPFERAGKFLSQIAARRDLTPEKLKIGLHLILVGYFKKLVIADNLATRIANPVFSNPAQYQGLDILLAALAFTFQLYGDFSGYTDIARGIALLLGFDTPLNFRWPYFSFSPTDFWQRWHISFSEWLRDYLFFPIRRAILRWKAAPPVLGLVIPPLVTMGLCGLWHGARWTFVLWGVYQAGLIILYRVLEKHPIYENPWKSGRAYPWVVLRLVLMFLLTVVGWIIFRSESLDQVVYLFRNISLTPSSDSLNFFYDLIFYTAPWLFIEVITYARKDLLLLVRLPFSARMLFNGALLASMVLLNAHAASEFIYVQF